MPTSGCSKSSNCDSICASGKSTAVYDHASRNTNVEMCGRSLSFYGGLT